jgi:hypothetical protein
MQQHSTTSATLRLAGAAIALSLAATLPVRAAEPLVAATFTATTTHMTPEGLDLRIQIIKWQEEDARRTAVATLAAGTEADPPLAKLPTVGYIWPTESPVGYSVKYAHRVPQPDGGERITLVTDRRLGSYDFKPWTPTSTATAAAQDAQFSVVELYVDEAGAGTGNFSLAAEVSIDEDAGTVSLAGGAGAENLLADVKRQASRP